MRVTKRVPDPIARRSGILSAYFSILSHNGQERRRIFCGTFAIAFLYAIVNDVVVGRAPEKIANEVMLLCVLATSVLPLIYTGRIVGKRRRYVVRKTPSYLQRPWAAASAIVFVAISVIGFCQTQYFISLLPYPRDRVLTEIESANRRQIEIKNAYVATTGKGPSQTIEFRLFNQQHNSVLYEAKTQLLADSHLNGELQAGLRLSLSDVRAVILPAWMLDSADAESLALSGLTPAGWRTFKSAVGHDLSGVVVRDREGVEQLTIDGIPRLVLFPSAFQDKTTLRFTLFHDLLHCLNVPGYYPSRLGFVQDDLTYLPEYRKIVREEGFRGWTEKFVWLLGVIFPLGYAGFAFSRLLEIRRLSDKSATRVPTAPNA